MTSMVRRLVERYEPICHLCQRVIDDLTQASADHVIPKVCNGPNGINNRMLAHKQCDSLRGAAEVTQARHLICRYAMRELTCKELKHALKSVPRHPSITQQQRPHDGLKNRLHAELHEHNQIEKEKRQTLRQMYMPET